MNKLLRQLVRFGAVGALCFVIDYALLIALTELFSIDYLISGGISFAISVIINYDLSMRYVFHGQKQHSQAAEMVGFIGLSISGLVLNEILMYLIVENGGLHYTLAKIIVTAIVMVYNFITRKIFLEVRQK